MKATTRKTITNWVGAILFLGLMLPVWWMALTDAILFGIYGIVTRQIGG